MTKAIIKLDNYSGYEIYPKDGKVWSLKSNKFLKESKSYDGYLKCSLCGDNGHILKESIHRLIYIACYGEIPKGMEVNHIDEDKTNNNIFNLNLLTHQENCNWGTRNERSAKSKSKPIGAFINGLLQFKFQSVGEVERKLGFSSGNICRCCNNDYKTKKGNNIYKGYEWKYIDEKVD